MFTAKQLQDFKAYRKVQMGGKYNMFDPRAVRATKLADTEYSFVMKNYVRLREAAEAVDN